MRETILAQDIYCSKPNPKPDSQSGSWLRKVLGTQALQCIREYNPTTVIATRPLTQPFTCKIGSSIFVAMSLLKVASAFLASNKLRIKTKKMLPLLVTVLPVIVLLYLFPTRQNLIHSLFHIGLRMRFGDYDANDGIRLDLP